MSKYTTEVRFICETYAGLSESSGYSNVDDILTKAAPKVFDFDFQFLITIIGLVLKRKFYSTIIQGKFVKKLLGFGS